MSSTQIQNAGDAQSQDDSALAARRLLVEKRRDIINTMRSELLCDCTAGMLLTPVAGKVVMVQRTPQSSRILIQRLCSNEACSTKVKSSRYRVCLDTPDRNNPSVSDLTYLNVPDTTPSTTQTTTLQHPQLSVGPNGEVYYCLECFESIMLLASTEWPLKNNKLIQYSQYIVPDHRMLPAYKGPRMQLANLAFVAIYRAVCLYDVCRGVYGDTKAVCPKYFNFTAEDEVLHGCHETTRYFTAAQRKKTEKLFKAVDMNGYILPTILSGRRLSEVLAISEYVQEGLEVQPAFDRQNDPIQPLPRPSFSLRAPGLPSLKKANGPSISPNAPKKTLKNENMEAKGPSNSPHAAKTSLQNVTPGQGKGSEESFLCS